MESVALTVGIYLLFAVPCGLLVAVTWERNRTYLRLYRADWLLLMSPWAVWLELSISGSRDKSLANIVEGVGLGIGTAASVTSAPLSATRAWIDRSSLVVTRCTSSPASAIRAVGHGTRGTGRRSRSSRLIRSERPWPAPAIMQRIRPIRPHDSGDNYLDARRTAGAFC